MIAELFTVLAGLAPAANELGKPEKKPGPPPPAVAATTAADRVAGEPPVEVEITKFAVVARIEGFDDLTEVLPAKFYVVPPMCPSYGVFSLPHMIIEALGALPISNVVDDRVAKVYGQQSVDTGRVAVTNAEGVAELAHARSPAIAAVERDMAPTKAGIIDEVATNQAAPIANHVV